MRKPSLQAGGGLGCKHLAVTWNADPCPFYFIFVVPIIPLSRSLSTLPPPTRAAASRPTRPHQVSTTPFHEIATSTNPQRQVRHLHSRPLHRSLISMACLRHLVMMSSSAITTTTSAVKQQQHHHANSRMAPSRKRARMDFRPVWRHRLPRRHHHHLAATNGRPLVHITTT